MEIEELLKKMLEIVQADKKKFQVQVNEASNQLNNATSLLMQAIGKETVIIELLQKGIPKTKLKNNEQKVGEKPD